MVGPKCAHHKARRDAAAILRGVRPHGLVGRVPGLVVDGKRGGVGAVRRPQRPVNVVLLRILTTATHLEV